MTQAERNLLLLLAKEHEAVMRLAIRREENYLDGPSDDAWIKRASEHVADVSGLIQQIESEAKS